MLNLTKLHNATRRGQKVDKSKFIETWSFELATPPFLDGRSKDEKNRFIEDLMKGKETEYRALRDNKPPLGAANILTQHQADRPLNPSFRPRTKIFCFDRERRKELLFGYRSFVGGYREVFDGYRKASSKRRRPAVEWPEGSYPPSCWRPVGHEKAA